MSLCKKCGGKTTVKNDTDYCDRCGPQRTIPITYIEKPKQLSLF